MGLNAALVDLGRKTGMTPTARRVEGSTRLARVTSEWFKCRLTLGRSTEGDDASRGRRRDVRTPMLVTGFKDRAGAPISISASDKIEINSRQLGTATYEVVGDPEPIRKKKRVIGYQVPLSRINEHPFTPTIDARTTG